MTNGRPIKSWYMVLVELGEVGEATRATLQVRISTKCCNPDMFKTSHLLSCLGKMQKAGLVVISRHDYNPTTTPYVTVKVPYYVLTDKGCDYLTDLQTTLTHYLRYTGRHDSHGQDTQT